MLGCPRLPDPRLHTSLRKRSSSSYSRALLFQGLPFIRDFCLQVPRMLPWRLGLRGKPREVGKGGPAQQSGRGRGGGGRANPSLWRLKAAHFPSPHRRGTFRYHSWCERRGTNVLLGPAFNSLGYVSRSGVAGSYAKRRLKGAREGSGPGSEASPECVCVTLPRWNVGVREEAAPRRMQGKEEADPRRTQGKEF